MRAARRNCLLYLVTTFANPTGRCLDHARAVCTQDPRLRNGRQPFADPDVEVVERRGPEADEHLARARNRIRNFLDPDDFRAPVLVDPGGKHGTILA